MASSEAMYCVRNSNRPHTMPFGADSACGKSLKWRRRGNDTPRNVAPVFAECLPIRLCDIMLHDASLEWQACISASAILDIPALQKGYT